MSSANPWSGGPAENGHELDLRPSSSSGSGSVELPLNSTSKPVAKRTNKVAAPAAAPQSPVWTNGGEDILLDTDTEASKREGKPKMAETWGEMFQQWPKTTICIVSNEFCERFSYYGMRTVLTLYMMNVLKMSADSATRYYNGFNVLCYLTPLFGCILADGYIGKFRTIYLLSILYTIGQITLAFASTNHSESSLHPWLDIAGLVIIGFGTGGIKPCVGAFGGDQFPRHQLKMISTFFAVFYFSINCGALISTFISPYFRAMPCLGQDSCYPVAFGIPAILMVVATVVFLSGSFWYNKVPPKDNVFGEVYRALKKSIKNKRSRLHSRPHLLDYYFETHFCASDPRCQELQRQRGGDTRVCQKRQFIADIKGLARVLVVFLPVPMFWALYDQQGSRWLIQSVSMDCRLWGDFLLLPDQMQTLNAVLILLFIPIFQAIVYPLVSLVFKITPLRKMVAGGFIASLAFVVSAAVQLQVNKTLPDMPQSNHAFMSAINAFPSCNISVCPIGGSSGGGKCRLLLPGQALTNSDREHREMFELPAGTHSWQIGIEGEAKECAAAQKRGNWTAQWELQPDLTYWMLANPHGVVFANSSTTKPTDGNGEFSIGITLALDENYAGNFALCRKQPTASGGNNGTAESGCNPKNAEDFYAWKVADGDLLRTEEYQQKEVDKVPTPSPKVAIYEFKSVRPGDWALYLMDSTGGTMNYSGVEMSIKGQGGVYMMALTGSLTQAKKQVFQVVPDNSVSILWQIPQIAIITAAEILFAITGLEFAYSQAAPSMKSVVQAFWLLTTSTGNMLIVILTFYNFPNMAYEFLFNAIAMAVVTIVLALLSIFYYEYNYNTEDEGIEGTDGTGEVKKNNQDGEQADKGWPRKSGRTSMVQVYGDEEEEEEERTETTNNTGTKTFADGGEDPKDEGRVNGAFKKD